MTEPGLSIPGPHFTKPEYEHNKNLTYLLYLVYLTGHDNVTGGEIDAEQSARL